MMQAPAFRNGKRADARDAMIAIFDALPRRAHGRKEIEKLLDKHRREWHLLAQTTSSGLIEYLQTLHLSVIDLTGEGHSQERVRYSWRDPTVFDVAQSLGKSAYISHQSAAFLHGIADNPGQPVFVNIEQSPKDKPDGESLASWHRPGVQEQTESISVQLHVSHVADHCAARQEHRPSRRCPHENFGRRHHRCDRSCADTG